MDLLAKSNTGVLLFWPQWPPGTGPTDRIGLSDAHNHSARVTSYSEVILRWSCRQTGNWLQPERLRHASSGKILGQPTR